MKMDHSKLPIDLFPAIKWTVYIAMICTVISTLLYPFHRAAIATASPERVTHILSEFALIATVVKSMLMVVAFILFLRWLFYTAVNSEAFKIKGLKFSPSASVVLLLVPAINIFTSLAIMLNMAKASFAANGWRTQSIALMVVAWWFAFLFWIADVKHPIDLFTNTDSGSIDYTFTLSAPAIFNYIAFFMASILFVLVIEHINRAQTAHMDRSTI